MTYYNDTEWKLLNELLDTEGDLEIFHKYCDPTDMTKEDAEVWNRWNKVFNPENYLPEEL